MKQLLSPGAIAFAMLAITIPLAAQNASTPSDAEIREILADRTDVQHKSVGMVVGIISPQGRRIISHGIAGLNTSRPLDGDTVFEIGSVSKVFTALLLADMVLQGDVALTDSAVKHLPEYVRLPERNGRAMTLLDLATHTAGLPMWPSNFPALTDRPGYANYTTGQLYQFFSAYELPRDIGAQWEYSNLDFGLLGLALEHRAGMAFETLIHTRITAPLGMESTAITPSRDMRDRLAAGHDPSLKPAPEWVLPTLAGAASLRSSANDLLTYLSATMGYVKSPLARAMSSMLETRRKGTGFEQALGWWVMKLRPSDRGFVTHGGGTFGYSSTVAYDPETRVGVVVHSNCLVNDGGLAWHILRPSFPVETSAAAKTLAARKAIVIDPKLLDAYIGNYRTAAGDTIKIERKGDALTFKSSGAPHGLALSAESDRRFFAVVADLLVSFEVDNDGRVTGLAIRFAGTETVAPRLSSETVSK